MKTELFLCQPEIQPLESSLKNQNFKPKYYTFYKVVITVIK